MKKVAKLKGRNASRAKQLAARKKKPKLALGATVVDPYGEVGVVDAIFADLIAVEEAGVIDDVAAWLAEQEKRPKTPKTGTWYSVVTGEGAGVFGELDLKLARP